MYTGTHFPLPQTLCWTRRQIYWLFGIALIPTLLYVTTGWEGLGIPWVPIGLIGTAAAFIAGFRNNATYDRVWEARTIYGAIVNSSRTWGIMVRDLVRPLGDGQDVDATEVHKRLIYRHIAWLTAMRYQLRQPRTWESTQWGANLEYRTRYYQVEEQSGDVETALAVWLSVDELARLRSVSNRAAQLLVLQGEDLSRLRSRGAIEANAHVALEQVLAALLNSQGACERIKNFPYPRQFATLSLAFVRLFVYTLPFGLIGEFAKLGPHAVWLTIPLCVLLGWTFSVLEAIGEVSENPFEGSAN
ncbi:MAG: multidrug transporter, partial [Nitrospira sp.]|nr:multidrug transporter [Nitrospira sp.]